MDFASNNGGWQWSSSTGTDSAPYFRVFNPTTQGQRFDASGAFIRRWVPEIAHLSDKAIHEPSLTGEDLWNPTDYPEPIVDQSFGRKRAISAFAETTRSED
jgi:deoxyribodipyrimidine photo-lyase